MANLVKQGTFQVFFNENQVYQCQASETKAKLEPLWPEPSEICFRVRLAAHKIRREEAKKFVPK
jgi:hypothetical protein